MVRQPTEPRVVEAVLRGDRAALGHLLAAHQKAIYNTCLRMLSNRDDAAEAAQEAMLKVIQHVRQFRGGSDIGTWIIRIAMNESISCLRKRKVRQATSLDAEGDGWTGPDHQAASLKETIADHREPSPDSGVQQEEAVKHLQTALSRIDEEFRAVLVLRDIQEMDYQQMADVLEVPVGTVKSRLFRARLALRQEMFRLCPPANAAGASREGGSHG